jgi:hypothetical protein
MKAVLHPVYHRYEALCEVMGREPGIELIKDYIDTRVYELTEPDLDLEDLDPLWEHWTTERETPPHGEIQFRISRGKVGGRVDRCMRHEVLLSFNDPELAHLVACYSDKSEIEARNPNIVFSRTTTLAKGGPYCDNCVQDKRHVEKIEHPPQEFYVNLDA